MAEGQLPQFAVLLYGGNPAKARGHGDERVGRARIACTPFPQPEGPALLRLRNAPKPYRIEISRNKPTEMPGVGCREPRSVFDSFAASILY